MSKAKLSFPALAATALLATALCAPLQAQSRTKHAAPPAPAADAPSPQAAASFQSLAPDQQKIVRALFNAQRPTAEGPAPLNLNQIAALRDKRGWSSAFKQMKAEGLVEAKTLSEVLSRYARISARVNRGGTRMIAFTDGNGHAITASRREPAGDEAVR